MTSITYPNNISNGDTPDWNLVQAYFDAIVTALETTGLTNANINAAAAIARSKLNLTGGIVTADLASNAVTTPKITRPTLFNDSSSALTNLTPTSWTDTSTTFTSTVAGLHVIKCTGAVTNNSQSNAFSEHRSRLLVDAVTTGTTLIDKRWVAATTADISVPFTHVEFVALTVGQVVTHEVYADGSGSDVAAGGFNMKAFVFSA